MSLKIRSKTGILGHKTRKIRKPCEKVQGVNPIRTGMNSMWANNPQSKQFVPKPFLQYRYEQVLGQEINSEHFQKRICRRYLGISPLDISPESCRLIESHAKLRRQFPRSPIYRHQVEDYQRFLDAVPISGTGDDLRNAIQRIFNPAPSDRTIRDWGESIGIPFYVNRFYSPQEIERWVAKLLTQRRFRAVVSLPSPRKIRQVA